MTHTPDVLRAIAKAATQGEWARSGSKITYEGWYIAGAADPANVRHIATFDPPTVLALLDRLAALEAERAAGDARVVELVEALALYTDDASCGLCERTVSYGDAARAALAKQEPGS